MAEEPALVERRVGDDRHRPGAAVRQHAAFDPALGQMVEHLVGRAAAPPGDGGELVQVFDVEVGHAPARDLAVAPEPLERLDGFG